MSQRFTIKNHRTGSESHVLDIFDAEGHIAYNAQIQLVSGVDHMMLQDPDGNEVARYRVRAFEERGMLMVTMADGVRFAASFSGVHHTPHLSVPDYGWNLDRSPVRGMYHITNFRGDKIATVVRGEQCVGSYVATIADGRHLEELLVLVLIVRFLLEHR
ncbi:MAG: hypothetical protein ACI361_05470 [Atopobiaceae bacterium]